VFDEAGRHLQSFVPFGPNYTGGVSVAAGDLNGGGNAEIAAGTLAAPARIRTFAGGLPFGPLVAPFAAGDPGVEVGVADLAGDGHGVLLAGTATGGRARLAVLESLSGSVLRNVDLDRTLRNGVRVAGGDLDGDGRDEIVLALGFGGAGRVRLLDRNLRGDRLVHRLHLGWGADERRRCDPDRPADRGSATNGEAHRAQAHTRRRGRIPRCGRGFRLGPAGIDPQGRRYELERRRALRRGGIYDVRSTKR
jgi:hypothetical protein